MMIDQDQDINVIIGHNQANNRKSEGKFTPQFDFRPTQMNYKNTRGRDVAKVRTNRQELQRNTYYSRNVNYDT